MKKKYVMLIILSILVFIVTVVISAQYFSKRIIEKKQLKIAQNIINTENQNEIEIVTNDELEINDNIIGILEIPKIELVAPIQEGTSDKVLKAAVGHFSESSFWNGNVALASHNRSKYVQYFEKINELQDGDEIVYRTKLGTRKYSVYESKTIDETDWSVIENTSENIITLITCVKDRPKIRLCVRAKEI